MYIPFLDLKREYLSIKKEIKQKISEILERGEYCYGIETEKFEKNFAQLVNCQYCVGTSSGTDSLIIALKALEVKRGDEVITSVFTFIATVEAIISTGAKPVLVDIDEETMNMDIKKIEKVITKKTKAIIPVHFYGVCVDMDSLLRIAKKHKLFVVEDCAHAEGSLYKGKSAGSFGSLGCFSFYPSKSLGAYGNAGAIVTNEKILAERVRMISNHGRTKDRNIHQVIGLNGRINNLQAGVLNIKLKYFKKWAKRKKEIMKKYNKAFENLPCTPQKIPSYCEPSLYVYTIKTKEREKLKAFLGKQGIETRIYYPLPLHLQPALRFLNYKKGDFPVAEKIACSILSLPLYPQLTEEEVDYIITKINQFYKNYY